MSAEYFPFSTLTAEGFTRASQVMAALKADPKRTELGTLTLKRLRSRLEVIERSDDIEVLQPGIYESSHYESGVFVVRSIYRRIIIDDGERSDSLTANGGFTHIKPSSYNHNDPLIPGTLNGDSVAFNVARLTVSQFHETGTLAVKLHLELGGEEPSYGAL